MNAIEKNEILPKIDLRVVYEDETGHTLRAGENLIHSPLREDRSPSFCINTVSGLWNDFGTNEGGDIIAFVQLKHGLDFPAALAYLSRCAGGNPAAIPKSRPKAETARAKAIRKWTKADYALREIVTGGLANRGTFAGIEAPDYLDRSRARECYHSICLHCADIMEYSKQYGGKLAGYSGAVWCKELVFDVDHKAGTIQENIGVSLNRTKTLIGRLKSFGLSSFDIAFSGNKGFHVTVSTPLLDKISGYTDTPKRIESLVRKLAGDISGLDFTIYGTIHLIRSLNSINAKSGLYKIPLTEAEIFSLSPDEIITLAKKPRKLEIKKPVTKAYSRLFHEQFTIGENGNVVFASGTVFDKKEIEILKSEKNKQAIKALYNIKKHFGGTIEKDTQKWKPQN